ncbi:ankyrin repeat domain-containing protein [Wolbachia endosymbiont of Ctenocephalides felis wCfeT]
MASTALHQAVKDNNLKQAEQLIKKGADINARDSNYTLGSKYGNG